MNAFLIAAAWGLLCFPAFWAKDYLERKLHADLEARIGPKRAGPAGILQPGFDFWRDLRRNARTNEQWARAALRLFATALLAALVAQGPGSSDQVIPMLVVLLLTGAHLVQNKSNDSEILAILNDGRNASRVLTAMSTAILVLIGAIAAQGGGEHFLIALPFELLGFLVFVCSGIFSSAGQKDFEAFVSRMIWNILGLEVLFGGHFNGIAAFFVAWTVLFLSCFFASLSLQMRAEQRDRWAWRFLVPLSLLSLIGLVATA